MLVANSKCATLRSSTKCAKNKFHSCCHQSSPVATGLGLGQVFFIFIYLFYDNLATGGSLTCAILLCHFELSKYSTSKFQKKRNINNMQNEYRTSAIKLSLAMYPFSNSLDEHVPLKYFMTKRLWKITRMYLPISI